MAHKYLYVPDGFIPLDYLPKKHHKWKDYLAYVLSVINRRLIFEKLDPDSYVPLSSVLLKRVLPRDYKQVLRYLIDSQVIECDETYQEGVKSKGYRLTEAFRGLKHRRYLITNPWLKRKLEQMRRDMESGIVIPVHRHLFQFLQQIELTNCPNATESISAMEIVDKEFRFSVCQYGRVHTNLTNLRTDYRNHLTFKGQVLTEIDIVNSQPLFLGILLLNYFTNDNSCSTTASFNFDFDNLFRVLSQRFDLEKFNSIVQHKQEERGEGGNTSPLCSVTLHLLDLPEDLVTYLTLCEEGSIYEHLQDKSKLNRKETKQLFFQTLFAENRIVDKLPLTKPFAEEFPSVMKAITQIKQQDYRHLAHLLQRTESNFVIHRVVSGLMDNYPEIFISTIHDSLITTSDNAQLVEGLLLEGFASFRINPKLKIKILTPVAFLATKEANRTDRTTHPDKVA